MSNKDSDCQERHVFVISGGRLRAIALEAAAYSIGRDPSNAIVIDVDTISRQHAILLRVPVPGKSQYRYRVIDGNSDGKASANGVFINDQKVSSRDLNNGDVIRFGQTLEASYLTVLMGEAEFNQYLEGISYHSLKSEMVNAKETMVADCLDFEEQPVTALTMKPSQVKPVTFTETLHEGFAAPRRRSLPWIAIIPSAFLAVGSIIGLCVLASQFHPAQSSAETRHPAANPQQALPQ
jgi:FHA domain